MTATTTRSVEHDHDILRPHGGGRSGARPKEPPGTGEHRRRLGREETGSPLGMGLEGGKRVIDRTHDHLIVLNKDEDTVSYVDLQIGQVVHTSDSERSPHEVTVTPDGRCAYVACAGADSVLVYDNEQGSLVDRIEHPEFRFPHGLAFTGDGRRLFLAATYAHKLFVYEVPGHRLLKVIPTRQRLSHMVHLDRDERRAYVPNIGSGNVTVVDTESLEILTHLPVGRGPEGIAPHPLRPELWVTNQEDDDLWVIDPETGEVLAKDRVGRCPVRLVFSPDARYALVANRLSGDVSVIDADRRREIKRIPVGIWAGGICFAPDGSRAFVANNKTNDVSVIDMASLKEVGSIDAGIHPDGIAYLPRT